MSSQDLSNETNSRTGTPDQGENGGINKKGNGDESADIIIVEDVATDSEVILVNSGMVLNEKERKDEDKNDDNTGNEQAGIFVVENVAQPAVVFVNSVSPDSNEKEKDNACLNGGVVNKGFVHDAKSIVIVDENVSTLQPSKALTKKVFMKAKVPLRYIRDKLRMNAHMREKTAGAAALNGALMVRSVKYLISVVPNDQDTLILFSLHSTLLTAQLFTFVLLAAVGFVNIEDASSRTKKVVFIVNHITTMFIAVITILEMAITSLQKAEALCPKKP